MQKSPADKNGDVYKRQDPDYPASLSKEVHRILREELHFDGVIMTDDLSMGAIRQFTAGGSPSVTDVSYTHLDVYKRQGWKWVNARVGRSLYFSAKRLSCAMALTSFFSTSRIASLRIIRSVLSPT